MTIENCKKLLAHYSEAKNDASLSAQARLNMKIAELNMIENMKAKGVKVEETTTKTKTK